MIHNRFGKGRDPVWLDTVNCTGNESSLDECGHNEWGQHDCSHNEDVAISCNQTFSAVRKSVFFPISSINQSLSTFVVA